MSSFKPFSTILGRLNRSPAEVLYDAEPIEPQVEQTKRPENVVPIADGDLKCVGGRCTQGGDSGTTGMYRYGERNPV
jgi:hypothetical protein